MLNNEDFKNVTYIKPISDIEKIIDAMAPFAQPFNAVKGEILRYCVQGKKVSYLLHSGSVSLYRRGDGIVLNSEQAPLIFGITNQQRVEDNVYIRVMENSRISRIPLERFNLVIESFELWKHFCSTLIYCASRISDHCARIALMPAEELVRFQLVELMKEPERIRSTITAANYIANRTYLSRSSIMRNLSELREKGQIVINRGILLSIKGISSD